jgi:hypothetical protein
MTRKKKFAIKTILDKIPAGQHFSSRAQPPVRGGIFQRAFVGAFSTNCRA